MPKLTKEQEERFDKTKLITMAGAWLECSDYEGTVEEQRTFLASELERDRKRCAGIVRDSFPLFDWRETERVIKEILNNE